MLLASLCPLKYHSTLLLRPIVSSYRPLLGQIHRRNPNHIKCYQVKGTPIYVLLGSPSPRPKLQFRSTFLLLLLTVILRQVHQTTIKLHWTQSSHVTPSLLVTISLKLQSVLLYGQQFPSYKPFELTVRNDPKKDFENCEVISTPLCSASIPNPKFESVWPYIQPLSC